MEPFHKKRLIKAKQKHSSLTIFLDVELAICNWRKAQPFTSSTKVNFYPLLAPTTSIPAYTVERITLYHQFGQQPVVFSTHEYFQNPNGYYQHNWMAGIALSILGIIAIGLGLFITIRQGKKKKQLDFANTTETVLEGADPGQEQETATGYVE